MKHKLRYRQYTIEPDLHYGLWNYVHDDYDGAPEYIDDIHPGDERYGRCHSIEECVQEIDWIEDNVQTTD